MRWLVAMLVGGAAIAAGCAAEVITPGQTGGATSGNGGATTTSTVASGVGGMGGGVVLTTSTGTSTGPSCNDGTVFIDIEGDGPLQHIDASCAPEGYLVGPGGAKPPPPPGPPPEPPMHLQISACPGAPKFVLFLGAGPTHWPASASNASISYFHGDVQYDVTPAQSGVLDVWGLGPVGGVIEGSFSGMVAAPGTGTPSIPLHGKFRVCRGPDVWPV